MRRVDVTPIRFIRTGASTWPDIATTALRAWEDRHGADQRGIAGHGHHAASLAALQASVRIRLPADAQGRITYVSRANAVRGRRPMAS